MFWYIILNRRSEKGWNRERGNISEGFPTNKLGNFPYKKLLWFSRSRRFNLERRSSVREEHVSPLSCRSPEIPPHHSVVGLERSMDHQLTTLC